MRIEVAFGDGQIAYGGRVGQWWHVDELYAFRLTLLNACYARGRFGCERISILVHVLVAAVVHLRQIHIILLIVVVVLFAFTRQRTTTICLKRIRIYVVIATWPANGIHFFARVVSLF